jgi:peptidoglycan hydrolase-like protein with peptidoglycan-binding domain
MKLTRRILKLELSGDDVRLLQSELIQLGLPIPKAEQDGAVFLQATYEAVVRFQREHRLKPTGVVNAETARAINAAVSALPGAGTTPSVGTAPTDLPTQPLGDGGYTVSGTVFSPDRAGVGGLTVEIVDKNAGPDVPVARAVTNDRGRYQTSISAAILSRNGKAQPDLQARVLAGETFLAASEVKYNATGQTALQVYLPANCTALPSEWETLTTALAALYKSPLSTLQENGERRDITYLANKTGWDARAVALAALADQFSQNVPLPPVGKARGPVAPAIPAPFYYALFRAGLPANADTLYQTPVNTVQQIWKQAIAQNVIAKALEAQIPAAATAFQMLGTARALDVRTVAGTSTLKDMLHVSIGDDPQAQKRFADLYTAYGNDPAKFWPQIEQAFGPQTATRLKLDGQLAFLTLNNAPLMRRLHAAQGAQQLGSVLDLIAAGFYDASKWVPLLDQTIPQGVPGATPAEQQGNYAEFMAAQLRLSYPTAVMAERVKTGGFVLKAPANRLDALKAEVHGFLTTHQADFAVGLEPVERYVARNNLQGKLSGDAIAQLKRLQRVYQITPTDAAMAALLNTELDSAYAIARYDEATFVQKVGAALGSDDQARFVYTKARHVHNAVLNIAVTYLTAQSAPTIGVHSPAGVLDGSSSGADPAVVASPTLEQLNLAGDYCTCEECHSFLSPAAYLVDLLDFIDRKPPDAGPKNPQDVLFDRRPDIKYLPLTCENTNTPLPYVDVVNEILEYFVLHTPGATHSLKDYKGHNTDDRVTSAELLASPQFVEDAAYDQLKTTFFPPPLPFNRPLEVLRRFLEHFKMPLHKVLEVMRKDDTGWRDIRLERLKLSPQEYQALADDPGAVGLGQLAGYADDAKARDGLTNVQVFTRRFGISYDDVVAILKTTFINPDSTLIPRLDRLGLSFATMKALKADPSTPIDLPAGLDLTEFGDDGSGKPNVVVAKWVQAHYDTFKGLITIASPPDAKDACTPEGFTFRYAEPDKANVELRVIDLTRMVRFIRLWKKLGWTIDQTDKAIIALGPGLAQYPDAVDATALANLDAGFQKLLPRLGVLLEVIERLNLNVDVDLPSLLACWSPIENRGVTSLSRALFHSITTRSADAAITENDIGQIALDSTQKIVDHVETLRGAFGLTGDEVGLITAALLPAPPAVKPDPTYDGSLTLANVSAIYRRGWLARRLELSVREFLALLQFSQLGPFADLDAPIPAVIPLIKLVQDLRTRGLSVSQVLYLIWNQDLSSRSAPEERQITDLARAARVACVAVASAFAPADDPSGALARARIALVYGQTVTDRFFGLLTNSTVFTTSYDAPGGALDPAIVAKAGGRLKYDDFRKQLSYYGMLSNKTQGGLKGPPADATFQNAVDQLYMAGQKSLTDFWSAQPDLQKPYEDFTGDFTALLAELLPELILLRQRQQVLAAVGSAAGIDPVFTAAILADAGVLVSAADPKQPAIDDFVAVATPGLSAQISWTGAKAPDAVSDSEAVLAYDAAHPLPGPPPAGVPVSGTWTGYLEVPQSDSYNIAVDATGAAAVSLVLGGNTIALLKSGNSWSNATALQLTAGQLDPITVTVQGLTGPLSIRWESTGSGWEVIPPQYLYSATLVQRMHDAYVRLLKARALATALKLTSAEAAYLAKGSWLNTLPVTGDPDQALSQQLRDALAMFLEYSRFKGQYAPRDERLLRALTALASSSPDPAPLRALTGWDENSFAAVLARFGRKPSDLIDLGWLRRVADAMALTKTLGTSAVALIVALAKGADPDPAIVRAFQTTLQARYAPADWLELLKPITDALRGLQRDALVAYTLQALAQDPDPQKSAIDTPDRLFEYFLVDVEMEPCMQTSRIRHALSSVQLFIERCLLNLEKDITLSAGDALRWEWMKRYRVWQAEREVFLWPENYLLDGLRDDASPIFTSTMKELLRGDITDEAAAAALLQYVSQLEEVAKLEPCGMYYEEASGMVHVVARTSGAHRKYFYRKYDSISWSPWEQIKLDIEGDPVIPVVWNDRLLLFWLRIHKKSPLATQTPTPGGTDHHLSSLTSEDVKKTDAGMVSVDAVLCWSEHYNGKWQPTKTSVINDAVQLPPESTDAAGAPLSGRSNLRLAAAREGTALRIIIEYDTPRPDWKGMGLKTAVWPRSSFLLYNTRGAPVASSRMSEALQLGPFRFFNTTSSPLSIDYFPTNEPLARRTNAKETVHVFGQQGVFTALSLTQPLQAPDDPKAPNPVPDPWTLPFIVSECRYAFYVTSAPSGEITVTGSSGFGVVAKYPVPAVALPPLVLPSPPGDSEVMRVPLSTDANVERVIDTGGTVPYGATEIGSAGSLLGAGRQA